MRFEKLFIVRHPNETDPNLVDLDAFQHFVHGISEPPLRFFVQREDKSLILLDVILMDPENAGYQYVVGELAFRDGAEVGSGTTTFVYTIGEGIAQVRVTGSPQRFSGLTRLTFHHEEAPAAPGYLPTHGSILVEETTWNRLFPGETGGWPE